MSEGVEMSAGRSSPALLWFIVGLFALSGFSGLIYESIWSQYLKLLVGHAAYAQTLVLAIFMGGMGIGAWLVGRRTGSIRNLLMGYAVVEGTVGLAGVVFHNVFDGAMGLAHTSIFPALGDTAWTSLVKWGIGAALIAPQSILLGMTFPLMSAALVRRFPSAPGQGLSALYFSNSAGAAIVTSSTENTRRGPQWSSAMPTRMRAGMVSATLAMANSLRSSGVSQFTLFSMLEASGAMPNQTKKQM